MIFMFINKSNISSECYMEWDSYINFMGLPKSLFEKYLV